MEKGKTRRKNKGQKRKNKRRKKKEKQKKVKKGNKGKMIFIKKRKKGKLRTLCQDPDKCSIAAQQTYEQDKTRQDKTTTQRTARLHESKKSACRFWRLTALSATRHSAVQRWPRVVRMSCATDTLTSTWAPAVGRPSGSTGCLTTCKKCEN